jgi:hypothetical protein
MACSETFLGNKNAKACQAFLLGGRLLEQVRPGLRERPPYECGVSRPCAMAATAAPFLAASRQEPARICMQPAKDQNSGDLNSEKPTPKVVKYWRTR